MKKTEIMEAIIAKHEELIKHSQIYHFCASCNAYKNELDELNQQLLANNTDMIKESQKSTIDRKDFFEQQIEVDQIDSDLKYARENYPKRELTEDEINEIYNGGKSIMDSQQIKLPSDEEINKEAYNYCMIPMLPNGEPEPDQQLYLAYQYAAKKIRDNWKCPRCGNITDAMINWIKSKE